MTQGETFDQKAERIKNEKRNGRRNGRVQEEPPKVVEFKWYTAKELGELISADTTWRVFGYLADGAITELDGKAKRAGKTTLLLAMCQTILRGEKFLGQATTPSSIVYLTEQSSRTFRTALKRADLLEEPNFHVLLWADTKGTLWPSVVLTAVEKVKETGSHVLVIDTLAQFAQLEGDTENDSGAAYEACAPLQEAASGSHPLAIILSRHDRKSGGDVGDSGRGSSAFTGAVDIVLQLRKPTEQGSNPNIRQLFGLSRYDETPEQRVIAFNGGSFEVRGADEVVTGSRTFDKVLDALPLTAAEAMTRTAIAEKAKLSSTSVSRTLDDLRDKGWLGVVEPARSNGAVRYYRLLGEGDD